MTDRLALVNLGRRAHWWRRAGSKEQGFAYLDEHGSELPEAAIERIRDLAIPPAWTEVRIAPSAQARLQAVGFDGKGKLQYLYHPDFRNRQDRHKFEKVERLGERLAAFRRATSEHIAQEGWGREKVLAVVVRLINELYFRVGSPEGVEKYRTYGITTLRKQHVRVEPDGSLRFSFDGKHHVHHRVVLVDERLGSLVAELKAHRGGPMFSYLNGDGGWHALRGKDVNQYLKSILGPEFTAKDFRTWHGTLIVAKELAKIGPAKSPRERKRNIALAVKNAASRLGNTPAVCRRSYLHPGVVSLYERGIVLTDVPLDAGRIQALESEPRRDELQLLELFHVARVLRARRSSGASVPKRQPDGSWSFPVPVPQADPASS